MPRSLSVHNLKNLIDQRVCYDKGFNFSEEASGVASGRSDSTISHSGEFLSDISRSMLPKTALNESYTISKDLNKLAPIEEESFNKSLTSVGSSAFESKQILLSLTDEESGFPHDNFLEDCSSDESLGILPHLIDITSSLENLTHDINHFCAENNQPKLKKASDYLNDIFALPFVRSYHETDLFNKRINSWQVEGVLANTDYPPFLQHTTSNDSGADSDNFHSCDLNSTIVLSNSNLELTANKTFEIATQPAPDEVMSSPVCTVSDVSLCVKHGESPIYNTTILPKFASTPKHETNFSYIIDEDTLHLTKNLSGLSQLNISENNDVNDQESASSLNKLGSVCTSSDVTKIIPLNDKNENMGGNILNVTCNLLDTPNNLVHLNKTFDNIEVGLSPLLENYEVPNLDNELNVDNQVIDKANAYNYPMPEVLEVIFEDQNVLNKTCKVNKIQISDLKYQEKVIENKFTNNNDSPNKLDILNTTYEKTDKQSVLFSRIKTFHSSKPCINKQNKKIKAPISPKCPDKKVSFPNSLKVESRNDCSVFNRKKTLRKSVGCVESISNNDVLSKRTLCRRNSLSSNSSISSKNEIATIRPSLESISKNFQAKTCSKGIANEKFMKGQYFRYAEQNLHSNPSLASPKKTHLRKLPFENQFNNPDSALNKTMNLVSTIPDMGKTVVKKSRDSANFSNKKFDIPKYQNGKSIGIPINILGAVPKTSASAKNERTLIKKGSPLLFTKPNLKKPSVDVPSQAKRVPNVTRIPTKGVLSQKNIFTNIPSSGIADNLKRPHNAMPVLEKPKVASSVPFQSQIPSISLNNRKQDPEVKSLQKTSRSSFSCQKATYASRQNIR